MKRGCDKVAETEFLLLRIQVVVVVVVKWCQVKSETFCYCYPSATTIVIQVVGGGRGVIQQTSRE